MRVLCVGNMYPPHHHGGYELIWQSAAEHLRARGNDVRVVITGHRTGATEPDPPYVFRELRWHLRDLEFESLSLRETLAMARHNHGVLDRHLDDFQPDVVTWWSMGGLTLTMLEAVRRRGLPAVAFLLDEWLDYGRWHDPWLKLFYGPRRGRLAPVGERLAGVPASVDFADATTYVFISEHVRRQALDLGLGPLRTAVAHSGIHAAFRATPPPPRDWRWRLLYLGRLDPRKGIDTAIEALHHLPPEAHLTVVGGGSASEEKRLKDLAARLNFEDRIAFEGQRDRAGLIAAYDAADAVLFPVRWNEPWGLVPIEAMARGRPVVATGRGGSGEYLRDGDNCLLFEAGDAEALAAAVRRLASDASLRTRLREGGLRTAPHYTETLYNEAVEEAVRAAVSAGGRVALAG